MKSSAIVQTGKRRYEQQEFEVPEIGPEEGLLRIEQSGICGSDWSQYKQGFPFPVIPGHEPVGILERVGEIAAQRWGEDKSALRTLQADNQRLTEENAALREAAKLAKRAPSDVDRWMPLLNTILGDEEPDHA